MKNLIYILFLLITPTSLLTQTITIAKKRPGVVLGVKLSPGGEQIITQNLIINPNHIERMDVLSVDEIKRRSINADAVWTVDLKSYVNLLTLEQFYNLHKIEKKYRTQNIILNKITLSDTVNLLIYDKDVKSVTPTNNGINIQLIKLQPRKPQT